MVSSMADMAIVGGFEKSFCMRAYGFEGCEGAVLVSGSNQEFVARN